MYLVGGREGGGEVDEVGGTVWSRFDTMAVRSETLAGSGHSWLSGKAGLRRINAAEAQSSSACATPGGLRNVQSYASQFSRL